MFSPRYWSVMAVALLACSLATPLPSPQAGAGKDLADALSSALGAKAPAPSFRVDVRDAPAIQDGAESSADNDVVGDDPKRQLSPATQSFLSTLGTALGPIVGAIVGPLLTNIGQNLSAGSGAQAIAQLQQAAQAAVAAQQQQQQGGSALGVAAAAAVEVSGAGPSSTTPSSPSPTTPSPSSPRPRPQTARPTRRPGARPSQRPGVDSTSPAPAPSAAPAPSTASSPSVASSAAAHQSFDAFVLDVPGKGPFLFLMTPNASAAEQSAAIKQAQQQAAQLLAVDGQSSPIGGVASLIGTTPRPQVTKPTSVGPLPVHPVVSVTPPPPPPNPLPSYHSLLGDNDDEQDQQGEEEVAVETAPVPHDLDEQRAKSDVSEAKEDDGDFSSQSFLEKLFPEMM